MSQEEATFIANTEFISWIIVATGYFSGNVFFYEQDKSAPEFVSVLTEQSVPISLYKAFGKVLSSLLSVITNTSFSFEVRS